MVDEEIKRQIEELVSRKLEEFKRQLESAVNRRLEEIEGKMDQTLELLQGSPESLGVVGKVHVLWKSWVWILCTASAAMGSGLTALLGLVIWFFTQGGQ